ncbi:uncharacterized protein [Choristoneura fumiferana]|uniref:uncharacterized protein n=1 Tax=Choristoneura fumiferana TaxID=7141 RepID=UPI003D1585C9
MYTETTAKIILGIGLATALLLILLVCVCICKDFYEGCCYRNRNRVLEEDIQNTQAIEMLPPDFVDVARAASILAGALVTTRRRQLNLGDDDVTSGNNSNNENDETDRQLSGEASGDGDKETENRGARIKRKRRVTFNLADDDDAGSSSKDKKDDKSKSPDDSDVKSSSDDDTVDKVEEVSSNDDSASSSRTGGGDAKALSPWADF